MKVVHAPEKPIVLRRDSPISIHIGAQEIFGLAQGGKWWDIGWLIRLVGHGWIRWIEGLLHVVGAKC